MNNNRGNNRRRGRGSNRQQGGQQTNRIDSRARGNAQQLLDKYKKLAHDAHLNGDRVQEEYYLQFADHYFRVLADQRQRQEDARQRRDDRWQGGGEGERSNDRRDDDDDDDDDDNGDEDDADSSSSNSEQDRDGDDARGGPDHEPADNPFVRDNRAQRGTSRQRSSRRSADDDARRDEDVTAPSGVDIAALPPSIGAKGGGEDEPDEKPRRRTRKPRASDGSGEALEAVS